MCRATKKIMVENLESSKVERGKNRKIKLHVKSPNYQKPYRVKPKYS